MDKKQKSAIEHLSLGKYTERNSEEVIQNNVEWVKNGHDNLYPQYLIGLYQNSAVHNALVNSISYMIFGNGIELDGEAQLWVEKWGLNDEIRKSCVDLKLQGGFYLEVIWSLDRSYIKSVRHIPFEEIRSGKMNEEGDVEWLYHCLDWENERQNVVTPIRAWSPDDKNDHPVQLMSCKPFTVGSHYYAKPDYQGAINWIEVDRQVAVFHNNNIANGMSPGFAIHWKNGIPNAEERRTIRQDLERQLTGASNAGKFFMTFSDGQDTTPDISPFELSDAHNQYQFVSEESTDKIMIGHRVTSPSLFGVKTAGQLGGSEELATAEKIFERNVIKPYQRFVLEWVKVLLNESGVQEQPTLKGDPIIPVQMSTDDFSEDDESKWLSYLENVGEKNDDEEWELVHEEEVDDPDAEFQLQFNKVNFFKRFAKPDDKSEIDTGLYKVRYRYSQNISDNSRLFCRNMVENSKGGVIYRFEDIQSMDGVNAEFAPHGKSEYSIWKFKGGCYCHHKWVRQIYFRKRDKGKFLPNDGLNNDKKVTGTPDIPLKDRKKDWKEANTAPIDTPSRGSLKNK